MAPVRPDQSPTAIAVPVDDKMDVPDYKADPLVTTYIPLLGLTASPILMLMPPRKLDLYTFSLAGVFVMSAEEMWYGRGQQMWQARQTQRRLLDQPTSSAEISAAGTRGKDISSLNRSTMDEITTLRGIDGRSKMDAAAEDKPIVDPNAGGVLTMLRRIWYGDEKPGWEKRRMQEQRERLEQGDSIWDIISDQINEVFGGKKPDDED